MVYTLGKNEAWYFIKSENNASIVYGHNAKDEKKIYIIILIMISGMN